MLWEETEINTLDVKNGFKKIILNTQLGFINTQIILINFWCYMKIFLIILKKSMCGETLELMNNQVISNNNSSPPNII